MPQFSAALQAAIDRDNRNMAALGDGQSMSSILEDIYAAIAAGSIGITADAADVDSLAKGGGHFSQDTDTTAGNTFGYKAGRFHNGSVLVTVAAGTIALTPSNTNYVEVDRSGTVSKNTSGFTAGSLPLYTIVAGVSAIATVTSSKPLLTLIGLAGITGALLSIAGATKSIEIPLGDLAATGAFSILLPKVAGVISGISFATKTAIATSDANYWTFAVVNKGAAGTSTTDVLNTGAANTTKVTGGSAIAAYITRDLTLHGTPANLVTAAGDVLEVTFTKASSATTMAQCVLRVDLAFTA